MFYSQFILAKKGPLGNIWIAAHLERKLRKNQVADTDIGVSVDSILSPDVPIALRLSSHLLLGVARIYSRKVNYLFDDCSDALLSVKQTFRSAAVDLPPEESKAPYHSITLPETFDLDDFDLPDNDISQGNFVDHHISSRDQITLQDNIEGTGYSTSKFGLDERFGDGDASGLDLDEELLLDNIGTTGHAHESSDPQASVVTMTTLKPNEHLETTAFDLGTMVDDDDDDDYGDPMDYAQAPSTPGLVEEPNLLSNAHQEVSDHLETECRLVDPNMTENTKNNTHNTYGDKQEVDWCSHDNNANSDAIPIEAVVEHGSMDVKPIFDLSLNLDLESADKIDDHHDTNEIVLEKSDFEISEGDLERKLNHDVGEKIASIENIFLRPCNNSNTEKIDTAFGCVKSTDFDVQADVAALENSGREETEMLGEACCVTDHSEGILKENNEQEHPSQEEVFAASSEPNSQLHNANSLDELAKNLNNSTETELPAPEKLLSVPEGHMDLNCGVFVGLDEGDAGSKIVSGMKRSFTESTIPEQSLNSVESSRLVRFKRTVETVPDDNDLLSSILVGKSSVLKVKRTPRLSVVKSMKRKPSAPRTGAAKRKMIMDEMMVLHGDTIRQQLTNTEKTRRVRKKAPCTSTDISMIQKQYLEDAIFLQPIFTGMSRELVSLHDQTCDISGITVVKNDVNSSPSLEPVAEMRLPSENNKNSLETMFEPILASHEVKNDHSLETASEPHKTSQNDETKEADKINEEISVSGVHTKPIADMEADISQLETLLDATDVQISEKDDNPVNIITDIASADKVQSGFVVETVDTNTSVGDDLSAVQKTDVSSVELGSAVMDVDNRHTISQNEFTTGFIVETVDTNTSVGDDYSAVQKTDVSSVEFVSAVMDVDKGHTISQNEFTTADDDDINAGVEKEPEARDGDVSQEMERNEHGEIHSIISEDGFVINGENNREETEAYERYTVDAEVSGFDMHDREELNYSAAGNDTEFLNVDDDDLNEIGDDHFPDDDYDDEEERFIENTGWSSRTRAVSKYLQTLFVKEANFGNETLSLDNLLIGKSRKEASRMFFEALVLKTRDYIHVEQCDPFDDVSIKPRTRLMKSDF